MIYDFQQRIHTLNENAVTDGSSTPSFSELDITFSHWEFNWGDGWLHNYWLAEGKIYASTCTEAFKEFRRMLGKIIPRISLVGQCYVESVFQPFLIKKRDCDIAWVRYTRDTK